MRVVFLGSPAEVIAPLRYLIAKGADHDLEVVGIVSQPARPVGRKKRLEDPPVATFAMEQGIPLLQPESAKDAEFQAQLRDWSPDVAVTAAYGQILNDEFLAVPSRATINIHPSLLPRYRGATPVPAALLQGDSVTGVSVLFTVRALDAGAIICQEEVAVEHNETAGDLTRRLFDLSGSMLVDALNKLKDPSYVGDTQDESAVTHCKKLSKSDGLIDWSTTAQGIQRAFQAFTPWPGVYTSLNGNQLTIESMGVDPERRLLAPGEFIFDKKLKALLVGCGNGSVFLKQVKPAGSRSMDAPGFWNGIKDKGRSRFDANE